jgi:hypothetical protein
VRYEVLTAVIMKMIAETWRRVVWLIPTSCSQQLAVSMFIVSALKKAVPIGGLREYGN